MKALVLAKYAPPALKGLISGSDREAAVRKLMDAVGGNADYIAFVRGKYDVVARFEVKDGKIRANQGHTYFVEPDKRIINNDKITK